MGKGWSGPIHLQRPGISDCCRLLLHILGDWSARQHKVMFCNTKTETHFSRYGIPDKCISDNGQQLFSGDFKDFSKRMEIKACNPSPHYPPKQWESRISSQISEKKSHEEVKEGKSRSHVALFEHRNTPTQGLDTRPAQHPMSSRTRTLIPSMPSLL